MYSFIKSLQEAPVISNRLATSANTPKVSGTTNPADTVNMPADFGKEHIDPSKVKQNMLPSDLLALAKDRPAAVQMTTILGAMYQARKRNPQVQMTPPMLITGLKDEKQKANMMKLFNVAKLKTTAQLAAMTKEIKDASIPKEGEGEAQVAQGGTPTEQQHAQQLLDIVKQSGQAFSAQDIQQMLNALKNASRRVSRNKNNLMKAEAPPAGGAGVINTG
jgi:hypothetical protein